jgi:hypothetical protein
MAKLEIRRIADQLDRVVNGPAWLGPSMMDAIGDISPADAAAHPIPGAHSIWELVTHTTAWLEIVRHRVERRAPRRIAASLNWPPAGPVTARAWRSARSRLRSQAAALARTTRALDDDALPIDLPGLDDTWPTYISLHGAAQHVAYHAGQIALLRKHTLRPGADGTGRGSA